MEPAPNWMMDMYAQAARACGASKVTNVAETVSRSIRSPIQVLQMKSGIVVINIRQTAWDIQATVSYRGLAANPKMDDSTKKESPYWLSICSWPEELAFESYEKNDRKFSCTFYLRRASDIGNELLPFLRSIT